MYLSVLILTTYAAASLTSLQGLVRSASKDWPICSWLHEKPLEACHRIEGWPE